VFVGQPECAAANFSNTLLCKRLGIIMADLQDRPGCSLPQACRSRAALKAVYRFVAHPQTAVDHLLPAFVRPAAALLGDAPWALVVHDSTSFNFTHLRQATGLGYLNDSVTARGLHLHSSLLLDADGNVVGLAHLYFWVRAHFRKETGAPIRKLPIEQKESCKWLLGVRAAHAAVAALRGQGPMALPTLIHVMDREGDIHEVFAEVQRLGAQAVIRCAQNRRVEGEQPGQLAYAKQRVGAREVKGTVPLQVPLREGGCRLAQAEVRSLWVKLRPGKKHKSRLPLKLWLIEVREIRRPPAGEELAHWWLWTMLPAGKRWQIKRVLRIYQARWRVEDYHRMLKTGCKVESLRLQDAAALMKVIAMQAWVALQVLRLRDAAKQHPEQDCENYFSVPQWQILWTRHYGRAWQASDGKPPLAQVTKWLGRLGGHLGRRDDGLPGAELLGRGLYALSLLLEGRAIAFLELGLLTPQASQANAEL
jgi:hypothetical protein